MATGSPTDQGPLLELIRRLLLYPYPDAPNSVELLPGRLPDDRSLEIPMLPGARLVGSVVYRRGSVMTSIEAVVDVDAPVVKTQRDYKEELRRRGWSLFEHFGGGGGFRPSNLDLPRIFRRSRRGPALVVNVLDRGKGKTDLRLRLDWEMPQKEPPRHFHNDAMDRIPFLAPPPDVLVEGGGGGGGESNWSTSATARTDMPVGELEAYFAEQLNNAGWTRLASGSEDAVAWSAWRVSKSDGWLGLLFVLALGPDERTLAVHIQGPVPHRSQAFSVLARRPWRRLF